MVSPLLVAGLISVFTIPTTAQDTRPRYSSNQYNDPSGATIPPDTVISVQMNGTLSSRNARVGDKFTATVTVPVYVNGRTVIPAGSIVEGRVTQVTPAKRMNRSGTIGIDFDDIVLPSGNRVGLVGTLTSDDPATRKRIDDESRVSGDTGKHPAVFIGGGGAIGAVLGGIAGGGKGAVLGGVAGAGAGVASILLSKGEEAQVSSGTPFGVQIKQALIIRDEGVADGTPADAVQDQQVDRPEDRNQDRPDRYQDRPDRSQDRPDRSQDRAQDRSQDRAQDRNPDRNDRPDVINPNNSERRTGGRADRDARPDPDVSSGAADAPEPSLSSPEMVRRAQTALKDQGYYEGEIDGTMSPRTSGALRTYQREHNLQETGDLDPETAKRLGITRVAGGDRVADRSRDNRPDPRDTPRSSSADSDGAMATVLTASANRTPDGAIYVLINTQANTGGWKWFGEQVVNGDTLEVYARAVKPTGMVTQALTRGRIELTVRDGVQYVRRVVIHSAGADQAISLGGRMDSTRDSVPPARPVGSRTDTARDSGPVERPAGGRTDPAKEANLPPERPAPATLSLQHKADELLSEYQRIYGVRVTGSSIEIDNSTQYREPEIELLFAIDSFANAAQLYSRLTSSLRDRQALRGATLSMARQARRTDRVISTTTSRSADPLAARWDSIRQEVLKLMQGYNISSSEVEN